MRTHRTQTGPGRRAASRALAAAMLLLASGAASGQTTQPVAAPPAVEPLPRAALTAGQIQQLLDSPVEARTVHEASLIEVLRTLEGPRPWLDLPPTTLSYLPYGEQTTVSYRVSPAPQRGPTTLRMLLDSLLDPLSLEDRVLEDGRGHAVLRVAPRKELVRIGRRAHIEELELLYTLRHVQIDPARGPFLAQVQQAVDQLGPPRRLIDLQFDLADLSAPEAYRKFTETMQGVPPGGAAALLAQFCRQGQWCWRVERNTILVLDRYKQVLHQFGRHVSVNWSDVPLDQALVQLAQAGGVLAQFQPAMMEGVEQGSRRITWQTPGESVLQIIEALSARAGFAYEVRTDSIYYFAGRSRDPMVGMVTLPSGAGRFNFQFFVRKSMLSEDAQKALDAETARVVDALNAALLDRKPDAPKPPAP